MSTWVSRRCSTRCQGVYSTLGGKTFIASSGKSRMASSKGMCASTPSSSRMSCSRNAASGGAIGLVPNAEVAERHAQHHHAKSEQDERLDGDGQHVAEDGETQLVEDCIR